MCLPLRILWTHRCTSLTWPKLYRSPLPTVPPLGGGFLLARILTALTPEAVKVVLRLHLDRRVRFVGRLREENNLKPPGGGHEYGENRSGKATHRSGPEIPCRES